MRLGPLREMIRSVLIYGASGIVLFEKEWLPVMEKVWGDLRTLLRLLCLPCIEIDANDRRTPYFCAGAVAPKRRHDSFVHPVFIGYCVLPSYRYLRPSSGSNDGTRGKI